MAGGRTEVEACGTCTGAGGNATAAAGGGEGGAAPPAAVGGRSRRLSAAWPDWGCILGLLEALSSTTGSGLVRDGVCVCGGGGELQRESETRDSNGERAERSEAEQAAVAGVTRVAACAQS